MNATETKLKGCYILEPQVFHDERGYFFESFNSQKFNEEGGSKIADISDGSKNEDWSSYEIISDNGELNQ